jgi:CRP-like cAMP-binding protein
MAFRHLGGFDMPTTLSVPPESLIAHRVPTRRRSLRRHSERRIAIDRLAEVELFVHCTREQLARIDRLGTRISTAPGCVLVREGSRAKEFYVVIDGHATVSVEGRALHALHPGQSFGEIGLLGQRDRLATVTAATPMTLLVLGPPEFLALLEAAPPVAVALLQRHACRLHAAQALTVEAEASTGARRSGGREHHRERQAIPAPPTPGERQVSSLELLMCV